MTLREFVSSIPEGDFYAIKCKSAKWQRKTTNVFIDNGHAGFTFAAREGFGKDWNLGNAQVIAVEVHDSKWYKRTMPCAVIE